MTARPGVGGAVAAQTLADHAQPTTASAVARTPVIVWRHVTVGTPLASTCTPYTCAASTATVVPAGRSRPGARPTVISLISAGPTVEQVGQAEHPARPSPC